MAHDIGGIVADQIRELYTKAYRLFRELRGVKCTYGDRVIPQWDGGVDAYGRRHKAIWPKIADVSCRGNVDPHELVRSVFARHTGVNPPTPNMMLSAAVIEEARTAMTLRREEIRSVLPEHVKTFEAAMYTLQVVLGIPPSLKAAAAVLGDPTVTLPPIFRYCMAEKLGIRTVQDQYEDAALFELVFMFKEYKAAWGDFIPKGLLAKARGLL